MSPTPDSTPSSSARTPEEQFRVVRKRNRVPLSCYPCRTKKLKCDRGHPCSNCVKRDGNNVSSCSYASPVSRKKGQNAAATSPDDMQNRIDRLEGLVLSLMHNGNPVDPSTAASAEGIVPGVSRGRTATSRTDSLSSSATAAAASAASASAARDLETMDENDEDDESDDGLATSLGVLKVDTDRGKSLYVGQEHWHTLLSDISEVKNYFLMHRKELETSYEKVLSTKSAAAREAPTFLLGAPHASEEELRARLPDKAAILTLCGRYFNSMDNAVNIIHAPTFNAQLRSHWQDPSRTPIMWLGLLYSILCLAMLSYNKVGDEPPEWKGRALEMAALYRVRTVQCLVTADYTKPVEYTVETMILYVFGEYSSRWDADLGLWMIGSLITRVAYRMGYHRDAKWFPSITPFQAEMRRRTWALVRMCDVMFSHQVSLPSMIYEHDCDTQLPLNIFDEDFGPHTKVLPQPRPSSQPTPISYMIAKVRLSQALGSIQQATARVGKPVPYDEILRLDAHLRQVKDELPAHLRLHPLERSRDPLTIIIARFNIDILYQKIMCILHRKYLPRARHNMRYGHSRRSAILASLETLHHLETLSKESRPNGRLRTVRWYVSSIATKDFMLPAMLVALELRHLSRSAKSAAASPASADDSPPAVVDDPQLDTFWTPEQRAEMAAVLETTKEIWRPLADGSMEAYKAYNILRVVLDRIHAPEDGSADMQLHTDINSTSVDAGAYKIDMPNTVQGASDGVHPPGVGPMPGSGANSSSYSGGFSSDSFGARSTPSSTISPLGGTPGDSQAAVPPAQLHVPDPALMAAAAPALQPALSTFPTATAAPDLSSLFGTASAEDDAAAAAAAAAAYSTTFSPTMASGLAGGDMLTSPPNFQSEMLSSMTDGFPLLNPNAFSGNNIMDESMDFSSNFDWETLQSFAQSGPIGVEQPLDFFAGISNVSPGTADAELGGAFYGDNTSPASGAGSGSAGTVPGSMQ